MTLYDVLGLNLADCMHAGGGAKAVYSDNNALRSKVLSYTYVSICTQPASWLVASRACHELVFCPA